MTLFEEMQQHLASVFDHHISAIECLLNTLLRKNEGEEGKDDVQHALSHLRELRFFIAAVYEDSEDRVEVFDGLILAEQLICMNEHYTDRGTVIIKKFFTEMKNQLEVYKADVFNNFKVAAYLHLALEPSK